MARESKSALKARAEQVLAELKAEFPQPKIALDHNTPFQLLIATMLSAQCTDDRVNKVTPALFQAAADAPAMAKLGEAKIRKLISSINFFNNKAKAIHATARILVREHGAEVPGDLDSLVKLPGVGRKTANVVLGNTFGVPSMVVDTHVTRLSNRLEFVRHMVDAVQIEHALMEIFAPSEWVELAHRLILHGRKTCQARLPKCGDCCVATLCPSAGRDADAWKS